MSRIITDNYINKLNVLIDDFEISIKLSLLLNFFRREVQNDQTVNGNRNQKVFSSKDLEKINELKGSVKLKRLFAYINIIIKKFSGQYLHIHINTDLANHNLNNLITLLAWEGIVSGIYDEQLLNYEIELLNSKIIREINLADGNRHDENRLRKEKKGWMHKVRLIKQILEFQNKVAKNGFLLNLNSSSSSCVNLSKFSEFPDSLNTHVNFGNRLQSIYDNNETILEKISTIINLFPVERGNNVWYQDFMKENIDAWNQLLGFNFSKVITITSGEKKTEALLEMQKQNKFQAEEIYTIFSFEF